jgi:hypothetical protein
VYRHVDDLMATFQKLLSMGATEYEAPTDREAGFVTASVEVKPDVLPDSR